MAAKRAIFLLLVLGEALAGAEPAGHPFRGVTCITPTETDPRPVTMHIVTIDTAAPGVSFKLTPSGGSLETIRQTTLGFLQQEHAQIAVNAHFFLPFPSAGSEADLIGLAASNGTVYSAFESPAQSYAIVADAPAINIDRANRAAIVHRNPRFADGKHVRENVTLWNALAGSAQIVTDGVRTIPRYKDALTIDGLLTPGGPAKYDNTHSWYDRKVARTVIGLSRDSRTLVLLTVDRVLAGQGLTLAEIADRLIRDFGVYNALNLDGGGSTTLAMEDPFTHTAGLLNVSSDNPKGRSVGSNLAIFAAPVAGATSCVEPQAAIR